MSEAVTVPSLMMMNLIVSEESLVRRTHTHARTHTCWPRLSQKTFSKPLTTLKTKKEEPETKTTIDKIHTIIMSLCVILFVKQRESLLLWHRAER